MRNLIEKFVKIIFPDNLNCILCDAPISRENEFSLCGSCFDKLIFIENGCHICGKPIINESLNKEITIEGCGYCKDKKFLFDRNISTIEYSDISSKLVFRLKYSSNTYLARYIADIMYFNIMNNHADLIKEPYILTFVPLSAKRMKDRGFNQSQKIGKYLSEKLGVECIEIVCRKRDTRKLFGLNSKQRKKELKNSFEVIKDYAECIKDKNIIIVDDIFTTGSTIDEISKELRKFDVGNIVSLTFLTGKYTNDKIGIDI